jgi:5-methyltetrahydropteroyltriglutamate--homocysteine methyltransferase
MREVEISSMTDVAASKPSFRAEVIGSLLRPRTLKDADRARHEGRLSHEAYAEQLDAEIARAIARQEDIGLEVVTDGEFGRSSWFGYFFEGLDGFRLAPSHFKFRDAQGRPSIGQPAWPRSGSSDRDQLLSKSSSGPAAMCAEQCIRPPCRRPPSAFHFFRLSEAVDPAAYPHVSAYFDDLVTIYRAEVAELAQAGCRYLQLDEVPVAMLCDEEVCR